MSATFTDLYQIIMAYGYWKSNTKQKAVFHLFFRNNPHQGSYTICSGLELIIEKLLAFNFSNEDLEYLSSIQGNNGKKIFDEKFITYLKNFELKLDVDAIPEGTVVFPHEPILRISGFLLECQLVEAIVINIFNYSALISTKASRIYSVIDYGSLLEFGLRRSPGLDGGLLASRSAYIGGFDATSNVEAGKKFNIPVKGTLSHSWILSYENESQAFLEYYKHIPNNCVFLVDTYDTLNGIQYAIDVAKKMNDPQNEFVGIRLDSGDLAYLSQKARCLLDEAGFKNAKIFASSSLDEYIIQSLKLQDSKIDVYAVGTKLVIPDNQNDMQTVYKLSSLLHGEKNNQKIEYKVKRSEDVHKVNTPGILQVRRFKLKGKFVGDAIFSIDQDVDQKNWTIVNPNNPLQDRLINDYDEYENLLKPILKNGVLVYQFPAISKIRDVTIQNLDSLDMSIKRLENPHIYPAGIEYALNQVKIKLGTNEK